MAMELHGELTVRDRAIISILALRVRALSVDHVARAFWSGTRDSLRAAARRLGVLETAGWVERLVVWAHPEIELAGPIIRWRPGDSQPDFGPAAYRLQRRWTRPPRQTQIVIASAAAGTWLGGKGGRAPRASETTHDLHLAAVYLRMMQDRPALAERWISEASLQAEGRGRDEKLPDALICQRSGTTAIEFGGAYSKRKLAEFHAHCVGENYAYEIW